ncbi:hypothetical protein J40TS1_08050 [Paenibacillus montaniterrae]|uniref:Uncharacterized protein n=1 Tax=Paenibacillus montaniterrae TaxID=429341 RepID=A0A919YJR3_9BACL|nr:hypothetical protein [Paenibacillus montaniterrae]GIP15163.1 hypothetical protein J40TS1_08050 [Paenibacillus montaniterrae]
MIDGYWTALSTIMLFILLLTGWGGWINKRLKLVLLLPSIAFIWLAGFNQWHVQLELGNKVLLINLSFAAVSLLLLIYVLLQSPKLDIQLIALYTAVLGLGLTMVRAFIMFSPWAGAHIPYWYVPLLGGILLGLLKLSVAELAFITYGGTALAEILLIWQQRGEYKGAIANLQWWDMIALSLLSIIVVKLIAAMLHKITLLFAQMLGKRMKS